jgi:acyl-coenzyme A thioesterase PaaI-like protein
MENGELPLTASSHDVVHHAWREYALLHPDRYRLMPEPSRLARPSHAVTGSLRLENRLNLYEIYQVLPEEYSASGSRLVVVAAIHLGTNGLDGHPGLIHGGILALLIDDVLGFAFGALHARDQTQNDQPVSSCSENDDDAVGIIPFAVTANLNVNYFQPVPSGSAILIRVYLQEWRDRKITFVVTLGPDAESSQASEVIFCQATSIYVIPRDAYELLQKRKRDIEPKDSS